MRRRLAWFGLSLLAAQLLLAKLPPVALLLLAAFLAIGLVLWRRKNWAAPFTTVQIILAACAFGTLLGGAQRLLFVQPVQAMAGAECTLVARAEKVESGYSSETSHATLRVRSVDGVARNFSVYCDTIPLVATGEVVSGRFVLEPVAQSEEYSRYADGVYLAATYVGNLEWIGEESTLGLWLERTRQRLVGGITGILAGQEGAVLAGIALGDKGHLLSETRALFRRAGISHLLVVSGLHLSLLCSLLCGQNTENRRRYRLRAGLALGAVLFMVGITGFTPSVVRAGIAAILYCVGILLVQPSDALTSLGLAAVLVCLQNSYAAWDVGLQLSVVATLGVLSGDALSRAWRRTHPPQMAGWAGKISRWLASTALVSALAAVFTLPVLLVQGFFVSGVSVLTNLLALPLVTPLLLLGLLTALCGQVRLLGFAARTFALLGGLLARLLLAIVDFTAHLPFAALRLNNAYTLAVLTVLAALSLWAWKKRSLRHFAGLCAPVLAVAILCGCVYSYGLVHVTLVGNGFNPCAVVRVGQQAMVWFRGGAANENAVLRFLEEDGISEIALLVDLRAEPKEFSRLKAQNLLTVSAQEGETTTEFAGFALHTLGQNDANLAVLDVQGYRVAMQAGRMELGAPCPVDVLLAGPSAPQTLAPQTVVMTSLAYDWAEQTQADCLYSDGDPELEIRPGRSVIFREVQRIDG